MGLTCEGYKPETKQVSKKEDSSAQVPLLTLENFEVAQLFEDDREYQYFCHFRDETVFEISDSLGFDPASWEYIMVQACELQPCLRPLFVAVAALSKANVDEERFAVHQEYAFMQYDKALK
jgi:hypothetical protein